MVLGMLLGAQEPGLHRLCLVIQWLCRRYLHLSSTHLREEITAHGLCSMDSPPSLILGLLGLSKSVYFLTVT